MRETRREFLWFAGAVLSGTVLELRSGGQNPPKGFPTPPQGTNPLPPAPGSARNQEVGALHSADVFSVSIYKQSGEIEKLAKQLKSLAKG
jgi:hypothetical protein